MILNIDNNNYLNFIPKPNIFSGEVFCEMLCFNNSEMTFDIIISLDATDSLLINLETVLNLHQNGSDESFNESIDFGRGGVIKIISESSNLTKLIVEGPLIPSTSIYLNNQLVYYMIDILKYLINNAEYIIPNKNTITGSEPVKYVLKIDNNSYFNIIQKSNIFSKAPVAEIIYIINSSQVFDITIPINSIMTLFTGISIILDYHDNDVYLSYSQSIVFGSNDGTIELYTDDGCHLTKLIVDSQKTGFNDIVLDDMRLSNLAEILQNIICNPSGGEENESNDTMRGAKAFNYIQPSR